MIIKAPLFVPRGAAAMTVWPFIFTNLDKMPKHLIEHEKVHLKQQIKFFLVGFAVLYFCSKKWKYRFELEAYRVSIRHGLTFAEAARHLSGPLYGNLVTYYQALSDLSKPG